MLEESSGFPGVWPKQSVISSGRIATTSCKAKNRATLPSVERKELPIASGVLDYFPDALVEVARVSFEGNRQHNPGQPLHWDRCKSTDEADAMMRHFLARGGVDIDGVRHSAKVAWRALALLQKELEEDASKDQAA